MDNSASQPEDGSGGIRSTGGTSGTTCPVPEVLPGNPGPGHVPYLPVKDP